MDLLQRPAMAGQPRFTAAPRVRLASGVVVANTTRESFRFIGGDVLPPLDGIRSRQIGSGVTERWVTRDGIAGTVDRVEMPATISPVLDSLLVELGGDSAVDIVIVSAEVLAALKKHKDMRSGPYRKCRVPVPDEAGYRIMEFIA